MDSPADVREHFGTKKSYLYLFTIIITHGMVQYIKVMYVHDSQWPVFCIGCFYILDFQVHFAHISFTRQTFWKIFLACYCFFRKELNSCPTAVISVVEGKIENAMQGRHFYA